MVRSLIKTVSRMTQSLSAGFWITQSKTDYINDDDIVLIRNSLVWTGMAMRGEGAQGTRREDCRAFHEMIMFNNYLTKI
jgi:hypothetical protein